MREAAVLIHRWAGLMLALFLVLLGLTGSLLAFNDELDAIAAPHLFEVDHPTSAPLLDPLALAQAVEQRTGGTIEEVPLATSHSRPIIFWVEPGEGGEALGWNQLFLDPVTGQELGRRTFGDIREGRQNLMPFVYLLHDSLLLGQWGVWILGIVALVWTVDCFIGFYLSLPRGAPGWFRRLPKAFALKRPLRPGHRLNTDLHRAGGLWMWPILLLLAWSSVGFTLWQVYNPAMALLGTADYWSALPVEVTPEGAEPMDRAAAVAVGAQRLAEAGQREGFAVERLVAIEDLRSSGAWGIRARTSLDFVDDPQDGHTLLVFDAVRGTEIFIVKPGGQAAGDFLSDWIFALHRGEAWGLPWRIGLVVVGLGVTMLSATGVLIWSRKRAARKGRPTGRHTARQRAPRAVPDHMGAGT
jgi:uncharacterized iron-regulated membrane protein